MTKQEFKELYAGKSDIDYDTFISKFQHNMIYDEDGSKTPDINIEVV